jgi:flavorubredoxin
MQTHVAEIAEDIFQISLRPAGSPVSFSSFVIRDNVPALIDTGHNQTFDLIKEQVSKLIKPESLRYICFSHYEPDECGSLNKWLEIAPNAIACVNKLCESSLKDFAIRPSFVMKNGDKLDLDSHSLVFLETPHFPHAWEASLLFDTKSRVLFSSDLGTQLGFPQLNDGPVDIENVLLSQDRLGYMPYGPSLTYGINCVRALDFETMATMHGKALDRSCSEQLLKRLEEKNLQATGGYR